MQYTDRPNRFDIPGYCAAIPGRVYDERGGVALDGVYDGARGDIRLWISFAGFRAIMRQVPQLQLAEQADLDATLAREASTQAALDQANATIEDLQGKLDRINGVVKDGFKVTRQMGRPVTKKAAA